MKQVSIQESKIIKKGIEPVKDLKIKDERWTFLKLRKFTKTKIYTNSNSTKYLHIGNAKVIRSEAEYIENLKKLDFPVATILEHGHFNSEDYYVELSVGTKSFAEKFKHECLDHGNISEKTFISFCNVICLFLDSQLKTTLDHKHKNDLDQMTKLKVVLEENPDLDILKVKSCFRKMSKRLKVLPTVYSHGDLTPRNIFEGGIIDFEFNSKGPVGQDVLTSPLVENFWAFKNNVNETGEEFTINKNQLCTYYKMVDTTAKNNGFNNLLEFIDDFILVKAFWSLAYERETALSSGDLSKWKFRKSVLNYCIQQYLNDKSIDTLSFRHFGTETLT